MQIATRAGIAGVIAILCTALANTVPAEAASCGDANRTGDVTVTDGVLVLRKAADLPSLCPRERCDMNVDGDVSVTDGVLALRVAAGVTTSTACSASQAGTIFGQIGKLGSIGGIASASGRARAAGGTTAPCAGGGFTEDDGAATLTYFDCAAGDFVTNGTLTFEAIDDTTVDVIFNTSDFVVSTGEVNDTSGFLTFTITDTDPVQLNGVLSHSSSLIGEYTDQFTEVFLNEDSQTTSGQINTTISAGIGFFTNVEEIAVTIYSPTLARVFVAYVDGDFDNFTLADGLCEPCSSGCGNPSLACSQCVGQCTGSTDRCGIDFEDLECVDGVFGPVGLCDPCTSNADCNADGGLTCFPCDENCTGSTNRCGSSLAFVECSDGNY